MKFFDRISRLAFIAIVVLILGGVIEIIALASPYWIVYHDAPIVGNIGHSGLWLLCKKIATGAVTTVSCDNYSDTIPGWLVAVRALNVIGMMFGSGALVFMGLYTFLNSEKWDRIFKSSALTSAILAGVLVIIGAIVYGASINQGKAPIPYNVIGTKYLHDFSWSFALSIIAAIFFVISGVLMGFARKPRIVTS